MRTLFISDLHLCPSRPLGTRRFLAFLGGPARDAAVLYILGDLFEYWAGDDDLNDAFNRNICAALRERAEAGTALFFMAGNRDFLIGDVFARSAGLTLLPDPARVDIGGIPTLLTHGDTLCTDDRAYQAFRSEVRSDDWQQAFRSLPLSMRKARIEALRQESEAQKRAKPAEITDVNPAAVIAAMQGQDCGRMIHGHTHRPARHEMDARGTSVERWVLPDWYERGGYLECDASGCRLIDWPG